MSEAARRVALATPVRRLLVALGALAVSALLFRGALADALVTRGDDAWQAGDTAGALRSYRKAVLIEPGSALAADRLAFQLALHHDAPAAREAIAIATRALAQHPNDRALLADRALAELQLHRSGRRREPVR